MNIATELKELFKVLTGKEPTNCNTISEITDWAEHNITPLSSGSSSTSSDLKTVRVGIHGASNNSGSNYIPTKEDLQTYPCVIGYSNGGHDTCSEIRFYIPLEVDGVKTEIGKILLNNDIANLRIINPEVIMNESEGTYSYFDLYDIMEFITLSVDVSAMGTKSVIETCGSNSISGISDCKSILFDLTWYNNTTNSQNDINDAVRAAYDFISGEDSTIKDIQFTYTTAAVNDNFASSKA